MLDNDLLYNTMSEDGVARDRDDATVDAVEMDDDSAPANMKA
jgi:hypothetical protein